MKSSPRKAHASTWTFIQVLRLGEPPQVYPLDQFGRLNPADVPRNPRRALIFRSRPRPISKQPLTPPSESEDPFIAVDLNPVNWDSPPEIPDEPFVELPQLKGIDEDYFFCC
jgi:hypothetical protein